MGYEQQMMDWSRSVALHPSPSQRNSFKWAVCTAHSSYQTRLEKEKEERRKRQRALDEQKEEELWVKAAQEKLSKEKKDLVSKDKELEKMVNDQEEEMEVATHSWKMRAKNFNLQSRTKILEKCQLLRLWSKLQKQELTVQGKS